jgi:hypothetical protein
MTEMIPEAEYFLRRAREENLLALKSLQPEVAAAHRGLSRQYTAKAFSKVASKG